MWRNPTSVSTRPAVQGITPNLALVLEFAPAGDTIVLTRWDRLGRSMQHLVNLAAELHEGRIGSARGRSAGIPSWCSGRTDEGEM